MASTSVTLNDLERRNYPYFALFNGIRALQADYVAVVEVDYRRIMSAKYRLAVILPKNEPRSSGTVSLRLFQFFGHLLVVRSPVSF